MTMNFERRAIAGFDLRVARAARTDRPTVVVTNAFPQSIRCWESTWDRLAEQFDLLAVDLPGFGLSSGSSEVMRPSRQAEVLLELLDTEGIDRAFLVGPDIGVPVTLWLASMAPERVHGVNVYDGPATWPTDFDPALGAATRSRLVRWLGTRPPLRTRLMKQNFEAATRTGYDHFEPSEDAVAEYHDICFDPAKHKNAFDFLGSYQDELTALEHRLPSIAVPVLVTWGAADGFVRPSNAQRIHDLLPNSELTIFESAGHFSHEDADQDWLDRFGAFAAAHHPPVR